MTEPAYRRIADALRKEIHSGRLPPGGRLGTQQQLGRAYGVGRDTVRQAVQLLREEGLLEDGRSGRAAVVAQVSSGAQQLNWHIERAFRAEHVTVDVWSLHTENLSNVMAVQADRVRHSRRPPRSIRCRVMLPDTDTALPLPQLDGDLADDRPLRWLRWLIRTYAGHLQDTLYKLREEKIVPEVTVEIRCLPYLPTEKRYVINSTLVLTGYYYLRTYEVTNLDGTAMPIKGLYADDLLFPTVLNRDDSPHDEALFCQVQRSFNTQWAGLATRLDLAG